MRGKRRGTENQSKLIFSVAVESRIANWICEEAMRTQNSRGSVIQSIIEDYIFRKKLEEQAGYLEIDLQSANKDDKVRALRRIAASLKSERTSTSTNSNGDSSS